MKRPPHGFTLIELLVVITIIGMLVGLLLPAVQMVREAARRTVCTNQLKRIALAVKSHSEKLNFFPSGGWGSSWVGNPDFGIGPDQPGGWIYQIMPYLDNEELHDLGKGNSSNSAASLATRVSKPLAMLYCPTRRAGLAYPIASSSPDRTGGTGVSTAGRTDYAINGGSNVPTWTPFPHYAGPPASTTLRTAASNPSIWPALATGNPKVDFNGIAAVHSKVTDAMISDNHETTYLIGEKYMSPENYVIGSIDATPNQNDSGDLFSAMSGDDVSMIRWGSNNSSQPLLPAMDRTAANNPPPNPSLIFGSAHGAGWIATFCDGHAQLIGWGIDGNTHQTMASINGIKRLGPSQGYSPVDPTKVPR